MQGIEYYFELKMTLLYFPIHVLKKNCCVLFGVRNGFRNLSHRGVCFGIFIGVPLIYDAFVL
jgi:hypothetical protein